MGTFELKKAGSGFHFTLKADNGQKILSSETYNSKEAALNGIDSVRRNATDDARYDRKVAANKKPYFVLKAANHQVIGNSEMYESESARDNGIRSVMTNAPGATLSDVTA